VKRTILAALAALALALVLAGCSNPFIHGVGEANSKGPSGSHGTVRLDFGLQAVARSTFKPDLPDLTDPSDNSLLEFYHFIFKQNGTVVEGLDDVLRHTDVADQTWELPLGDYTVTVKAGGYGLATEPTQVYAISADIPFTLNEGDATKTVPVSLTPVTDGTGRGTILFAFDYPAGATVTDITITPLPGTPGSAIVVPPAMETLSGGVYTTHNLSGVGNAYKIPTGANPGIPAGFYTFAVRLRNSQGFAAGNSAVVHIYAGMTTYVGDHDVGGNLTAVAPDFAFVESDFAGLLVDGVALSWGGVTVPGDQNRTDADLADPMFLYKNDPVAARQRTITVSGGAYAKVTWYLDGVDISVLAVGGAYTLDASALSLGSHTLSITVETPAGPGVPAKSWSQHIPVTVEALRPIEIGEADFKATLQGLTTPGNHVVTLTENVNLTDYIELDKPDVHITLKSSNGSTITQSTDDAAFVVRNDATLTLRDIKLLGAGKNSGYLENFGIKVYEGGALIMEAGAEIRGFSAHCGAGVYVEYEGAFLMRGGVIAGNTSTASNSDGGGGVQVCGSDAFFEKTGGIIYGNEDSVPEADRNEATAGDGWGHAVLVYDDNETFPHRDTTLGEDDHLSVTLNGDNDVDAISGDWQYQSTPGVTGWNALDELIAANPGASSYEITLTGSQNLAGVFLNMPGVTITVKGGGTITQNADKHIFRVKGGTLILENITLLGGSGYQGPGVTVSNDGTLIMRTGAVIRGFTADWGAGVFVNGGTFRMEGGVIAGNTATDLGDGGGGVQVYGVNASFEMTGGVIYGNEDSVPEADRNKAETGDTYGHAVLVWDADGTGPYRDTTLGENDDLSVTLDGFGNVMDPISEGWQYQYTPGGGDETGWDAWDEFIASAPEPGNYEITLTGPQTLACITLDIPGVTLTVKGGGTIIQDDGEFIFYVREHSTLILENITLLGDSGYAGSGVLVGENGTLVMQAGAEIRGFTAPYGAGVRVEGGTFRMEGGVIAGNHAGEISGGGGVSITGVVSHFEKTGGIIYGKYLADGSTLEDTANANTTLRGDGWGHAVLVLATTEIPYRDTTVGVGDNLSVTLDGFGDVMNPISEGWQGWDYD
jgi:predicted small secreted protein